MSGVDISSAFAWPDAWFLLAVCFSHEAGGATLDSLISSADYINRAIPKREELQVSLSRLVCAGLVIKNHDRFDVTEEVYAACRLGENVRRSTNKVLDLLEVFLQGYPPPGTCTMVVRIGEEEYQSAYEAYIKRFWSK